MDKEEFLKLVQRYNNGIATQAEIEFLIAYDQLFENEEAVLAELSANEKEQLKLEIAAQIKAQMISPPIARPRQTIKLTKWLTVAAVLVISLGIGFFFMQPDEVIVPQKQNSTVQSKIVPGSNQAILKLANGKTITLNDKANGVLAKQSGVIITKNKDGLLQYEVTASAAPSINTISTPKGGQYQLILADGTKVWLNAASSITFPTKFNGKMRNVEVTGEAYFEVAKNKAQPFQVKSTNQIIEVLGTHFNVNTYDDELANVTTLLEGSVKVNKLINGKLQSGLTLKPGEKALVKANGSQILKADADAEEAIAWKNGYFKFDKADLPTIMRQIARWYNVDVQYQGEIPNDLFVGKIKRTENVSEVLRILELSKVNTRINGRTIIVSN